MLPPERNWTIDAYCLLGPGSWEGDDSWEPEKGVDGDGGLSPRKPHNMDRFLVVLHIVSDAEMKWNEPLRQAKPRRCL